MHIDEETPLHKGPSSLLDTSVGETMPPARRMRAASMSSYADTEVMSSNGARDEAGWDLESLFQQIAGIKDYFDQSDLHNALESNLTVREFCSVTHDKNVPMTYCSGQIMVKIRKQCNLQSSKVFRDVFINMFSVNERTRHSFFKRRVCPFDKRGVVLCFFVTNSGF